MNLARTLLLLALAAAPVFSQIWDRAGNNKLSGEYLYRDTGWAIDAFGDMSAAYSIYGVINFDGRGNYTITSGTYFNLSPAQLSPYTLSGTYSIGSNGYGFMQHPNPLLGAGRMLLTVANGVVIGSSVDIGFNDMFLATPLASITAATLNGDYSMAYMNFNTSDGLVENHYDALAKFNANGSGNIGNVQVRAYLAGSTNVINLTETGVRYQVQGGVGRIDFPTTANLAIRGQQMLGISPDGNLIFGGSLTGVDFWVGVRRTANATPDFSGLYFIGGLNLDASAIANGGAFDSYLGALVSRSGVTLGHQRLFTPRRQTPLNYTYSADFPSSPPAEYTDTATSTEWIFSAEGTIRVGFGVGPYLGIAVAVRAPDPTPSPGPNVSSIGVLNGASFAPFTAGIARGQLITLFGSEMADATLSAGTSPLPVTLGGVEVRINNRAAPLIFVSPGQISAIVPYGTTEGIAQIQVVRNGTVSNAVTAFVYNAAPGVFTQNAAGYGFGAVLDLEYRLVTPENRVDPGEFVAIYLTGLGDVFPTVQDGAPGGTVQLNETLTDPVMRIGGKVAEVVFSGLAPGFPGLYQVNAKVPDGVFGDASLEVEMGGGFTAQALLPVTEGASAARALAPGRR